MPVFVNGVEISDHAINAELQYHPAGSVEEAREAAARALVVRELLLQAAARRGIDRPDPPEQGQADERETDDEALIRTLIAREVRTPEPDEANCRRFYEQNLKRFRSPDLFEAAHILFPADPEDADGHARKPSSRPLPRCRRCWRRRSASPIWRASCRPAPRRRRAAISARSAAARRCRSSRPSCTISSRARSARCRSRPASATTSCGWTGGSKAASCRSRRSSDQIAAYLREHVWRRAVSQYLQLLVGQAEIRGIELNGASTPLVQ